jgi:hypothetical protein
MSCNAAVPACGLIYWFLSLRLDTPPPPPSTLTAPSQLTMSQLLLSVVSPPSAIHSLSSQCALSSTTAATEVARSLG